MPAAANAICLMRPKLVLRSGTAKTVEHGGRCGSQQQEIPGLAREFEFHIVPPARRRAQAPHQFLEFFKYYNTFWGVLCYNKENSTQIPWGGAHERCFSILLLAPFWALSYFCCLRKTRTAASSTAPAACPSSAPTCRWTTASTGWTSTARTMSSLRVPPGERRRLHPPPDAPSAHPAAAGHPLHPPVRPGPPDHRDPHLHPGSFWLQRAAVPARDAGRVHAAQVRRPPHKIIPAKGCCFFLIFWYTYS